VNDEEVKPEELTPADIAVMEAEYGILLRKMLNNCNGANPRVAMAALIGAAGSISVQVCETELVARSYLYACVQDVGDKLSGAFKQKTQQRLEQEAKRNGLDS